MSLIYCEPYDRCARSTGHRLRLSDSYDYQNRLVWRRMDGNGDGDYEQKRVFVYDGNQVVMDFQRTGAGNIQASNLKWRYLWGPAVDQVLAEEAVDGGTDDLVQWTLTDHLNTVRDIARFDPQTGATTVVNHLVYDAFGKVTAETNPAVDSLFLFTARPFDPDTQLQNNLNRWYDARVGRWLSEDPIGFAAGDGNLYRYVGNNPLSSIDIYGLVGCQATKEYYFRGHISRRAIPLSISRDTQTNPAGKPFYFLRKLLCAVSVPIIAKYKCCCHGKEHVVYRDAEGIAYTVEDVFSHNIFVTVQEIQVPLPPPLDRLPFGPSIIVGLEYLDDTDRSKAESFCRSLDEALIRSIRVYPSEEECPFHS